MTNPLKVRAFLAHLAEHGDAQPVVDHLLAVSRATHERAAKTHLGPAGAVIGLLHDLGKYSAAFQAYLRQIASSDDTEAREFARGTVDHSTAGAQLLWRGLRPKGRREQIAGEMLALCVASHHSGLIDCIAPGGNDNLSKRMEKVDAESHLSEARANADVEVIAEAERLLEDPRVVSDLIGILKAITEREGQNGTILQFKVGLLTRLLFSCLIDADRTDTVDSASPAAAGLRQPPGRLPGSLSFWGLRSAATP